MNARRVGKISHQSEDRSAPNWMVSWELDGLKEFLPIGWCAKLMIKSSDCICHENLCILNGRNFVLWLLVVFHWAVKTRNIYLWKIRLFMFGEMRSLVDIKVNYFYRSNLWYLRSVAIFRFWVLIRLVTSKWNYLGSFSRKVRFTWPPSETCLSRSARICYIRN